MKIKTLLLSCLMLLGISAQADDLARVVLMHNGQATFFVADKIQDAMNQAVDGDTIMLSDGQFPGFSVTKSVLVRGTGRYAKTGNIVINIPNNPQLTLPLLEGLAAGNLTISQPCTNLHVRKCNFASFINNANSTPNALIDRCYFSGTFTVTQNMTDFYVRNTEIEKLDNTNKKYNFCNFINCNIDGAVATYASGRFINCNIWNYGTIQNSMLIKTLVHTKNTSVGNGSVAQDCYYYSSDHITASTELLNKGYLGLDGTIVGIYGGVNPRDYNIRPGVPHEVSGTIAIDNETKKLNVEMEISPN